MLICESFVHSHILFKYMYMYCVLIYMQWENQYIFHLYFTIQSAILFYQIHLVLFFLQDI